MKIFYKILASVLLFLSVIITFSLGAGLTVEGINLFSPFIDTQFARYYSQEKFELIKRGQSIKEVESLLGLPLKKRSDSVNRKTEYIYTTDGKLYSNKKNGDFAWYRSAVYFDQAGKVIKIDKGWSFD